MNVSDVGRIPHASLDSDDWISATVAVVGASGFLGGSVLRALAKCCILTTAVHRNPQWTSPAATKSCVADLSDVDSLRNAFRSARTVVHAASYAGLDPMRLHSTNIEGTANVLRASADCGVQTVIYLSTIGVYGLGPHRVVPGTLIEPRPVTSLSKSRHEAERLVLAAGGIVLRTGFVYGVGDKTFLPGLAHIVAKLQVLVDHGQALQSVISIEDVGSLAASVIARAETFRGMPINVCNPEPASTARLIRLATAAGLLADVPLPSVSFDVALGIAEEVGLTPRHVDLVGHDHVYAAQQVWAASELRPLPLGTDLPTFAT